MTHDRVDKPSVVQLTTDKAREIACTTFWCSGLVAAEVQLDGHWLPYCTTCAKGHEAKYGKTVRWIP